MISLIPNSLEFAFLKNMDIGNIPGKIRNYLTENRRKATNMNAFSNQYEYE